MVMVVKCVGKAWHMQHSMGRIYDSSTLSLLGPMLLPPHACAQINWGRPSYWSGQT